MSEYRIIKVEDTDGTSHLELQQWTTIIQAHISQLSFMTNELNKKNREPLPLKFETIISNDKFILPMEKVNELETQKEQIIYNNGFNACLKSVKALNLIIE